jgi:quinoprotein glucose dehydrogenase
MKKITFIALLYFFQVLNIFANESKLDQIINGFDNPWSLTFLDNDRVLITEKSGNILLVNFNNKKNSKIKHNLNILEDGQGGLLEVLYYKDQVFVSYTEDRKKEKLAHLLQKQNLMTLN